MKKGNLNTEVTFLKSLKKLLDEHEINFEGDPLFKKIKDTQRFMSMITIFKPYMANKK